VIVVRTAQRALDGAHRPAWSRVTSAGRFRVPLSGGRFDRHFHDCDEYWLICSGCAKVTVGGEEAVVSAGDIVCTPAGTEHDVIEVYADLEAFWFEDTTPAGGRVGHLHRDAAAAAGHPVPARPMVRGR
jgi:mannose-6-phosphate isomerase-like protein (cupin superfamily)